MNLFMELLRDEHGFVLSAESVLLGTVGVIGATVGLSAAAKSVNDELTDVALAFRSLDQSYCIEGASRCGAWSAGSSFRQTPAEQSVRELREEVERAKAEELKRLKQQQAEARRESDEEKKSRSLDKDGDPQPPSMKKPGEKKPNGKNSQPGKPKKRKTAEGQEQKTNA